MRKTETLTDIMLSLELISILDLSEVESTMNLQFRNVFLVNIRLHMKNIQNMFLLFLSFVINFSD
jgi:hypothetical protein